MGKDEKYFSCLFCGQRCEESQLNNHEVNCPKNPFNKEEKDE